MRDILNTFGDITSKASGAFTEFPFVVDAGAANSLGREESLYVNVTISTKAPASTDTITVKIKDSADKTSSKELHTEVLPARAWKIGDTVSVKLPVEHLQYFTCEAAVLATSGVGLTAYLERG